eukprot:CAMPEP_0114499080 /NCGR_PEP_ID=MMETSP0109-20121206/7221_1 /TAXON_ID=29199 /ORGANISM="Chlorarachnion reptans, Strain CCCM449" /LENGTH=217 /DNA_ID=CAMNT_0001676613 /DNA_START=86 /DNA_END=736 /DNA_ORIENTATION=-
MKKKRAPFLASSFILRPEGPSDAASTSAPLSTASSTATSAAGISDEAQWSEPLGIERVVKPLPLSSVAPSQRDVLCEVVATASTLRRLRVVSGSWVEIRATRLRTACIARLYASDETMVDETVASKEGEAKRSSEKAAAPATPQSARRPALSHGVVYAPPSVLFNLGINAMRPPPERFALARAVRVRRWRRSPKEVAAAPRRERRRGSSDGSGGGGG